MNIHRIKNMSSKDYKTNRKEIQNFFKRINLNKSFYYKHNNINNLKKFNIKISQLLSGIKQRCGNINNSSYKYYGERGIKCFITEKELKTLWIRDKAWELEMASIDRIDNNGNYTFENCRFIELQENIKKSWLERKNVVSPYFPKIAF